MQFKSDSEQTFLFFLFPSIFLSKAGKLTTVILFNIK